MRRCGAPPSRSFGRSLNEEDVDDVKLWQTTTLRYNNSAASYGNDEEEANIRRSSALFILLNCSAHLYGAAAAAV